KGDGPKAAELGRSAGNLSSPVMWRQTDGALFWKLTTGKTPMPATKLPREDRWHIVNYIRTLAITSTAASPPSPTPSQASATTPAPEKPNAQASSSEKPTPGEAAGSAWPVTEKAPTGTSAIEDIKKELAELKSQVK